MMEINGKMYVKGNTHVTKAALERLAELGVKPTLTREGAVGSFFFPSGNNGAEFIHKPGCPATAGSLRLRSE